MKILHIMAGRGQGGAELYSTDVMLSLHQTGVDQTVVLAADAPRFSDLRRAGIKLAPQILNFRFFRAVQRWRLRRLIRLERPDIIQCWMRRAASLVPTAPKDVPVIGWFGGYYDPRHFIGCTDFVGVTADIVAHMRRHGVANERAHVIPTFPTVETQLPIDRLTLSTPRDAKILLVLARLHPKKGIDTMLRALVNLPDCYLWLAGEGPLRRELEALAGKLGVLERVRFLGWRTDRGALLRSADLFVVPSRYEPFGTIMLEAWAAGTPLVACRSAGPAALITDGLNGLLVAIDDADGLASAIRRALGNEELRRQLVAQGYAAYIKSYTREAVTRQWLAFYQRLLTPAANQAKPAQTRAA